MNPHLIDKTTPWGWHCWAPLHPPTTQRPVKPTKDNPKLRWDPPIDAWWRCTACHAVVPGWALDEGFWPILAGMRCPDMLRALPRTTEPEQLTLI